MVLILCNMSKNISDEIWMVNLTVVMFAKNIILSMLTVRLTITPNFI